MSSWTHRIALPHLLHTVILTGRNHTAFSEGVVNSQLVLYVKRISIGTWRSSSSTLTSCTSLTALIVSPDQILSLHNSPPFQFLTHLSIIYTPLSDVDFIKRSPQLTHFYEAVYRAHGLEFHKALFRAYGAQLVMVVVRVTAYDFWDIAGWIREMRKVEKRMYLTSSGMMSLDWMQGTRDNL